MLAGLALVVGFFCAGCLSIRNAATPTNNRSRINAICISPTQLELSSVFILDAKESTTDF